MLKNTLQLNNKKGFVLLYAVLVVTVVLAVGLILINIITKQITLSIVGRNSQVSFYAADSGRDCMQYWYLKNNFGDFNGNTGEYVPNLSPVDVDCGGGQAIPVNNSSSDPATSFSQTFNFFWGNQSTGPACSKVFIQVGGVDDIGPITSKVISSGYNQSKENDSICTSLASNRLTERVIETRGQYTGSPTPPTP